MSKLLLKNARLSFPSLFKKVNMPGETDPDKAAYSATFILDKEKDAKQIEAINAEIQKALALKFPGKVPKKFKSPLHDGDLEDQDELQGKVFLRSATKRVRPTVVDRHKAPLTAEDDGIYAGCYVHATVSFWCWDHKTGGKGCSANLRAVMFAKDGEAFGAKAADADEDFEDIEDLEEDDFMD